MMKHIYKRGFTLIELLVVIAIIGILASVVLASLNSARDKGEDAANRSSANNMRAQAELFYDDNSNTYTGLCTTSDADNNGSTGVTDDTVQEAVSQLSSGDCDSNATAYAIETALTTGSFYCVDSTGKSTTTGGAKGGSATACP